MSWMEPPIRIFVGHLTQCIFHFRAFFLCSNVNVAKTVILLLFENLVCTCNK